MDKLVEMATELGKAIKSDERYVLLEKAQKAARDDKNAVELIDNYKKQAEFIRGLEQDGKPVEVHDKHKLRELESKMGSNETLKDLTRRQVDFVDIMRKVNQAIDAELAATK